MDLNATTSKLNGLRQENNVDDAKKTSEEQGVAADVCQETPASRYTCPICGVQMKNGKYGHYCSSKHIGGVFETINNVPITQEFLDEVVRNGKTDKEFTMSYNGGKPYIGTFTFENGKIHTKKIRNLEPQEKTN